jgi:lycopene cyclase-like protein
LIRRVRPTRPLAFQAAYGILGTFTRPPVAPGAMSLMDYRDDHLTPAERRDEPPTFLYAMDMGEGQYFVEETSLAHAPAMPLEQLEHRLHRRLAHAGVAVTAVRHVERCLFPMNHAMPDLRQPVIGFGGAASMVHPATGYQVGAALTLAPRLAAALATALAQPGATPATLAEAGWDAVWPTDRRRRHALYHFGLDALMDFDAATLQAFFATFFAQPLPRWADYLSNRHTTSGVLRTMWGIFLAAPWAVQWGLVSHGVRTLAAMARGGRTQTSSPAPSP